MRFGVTVHVRWLLFVLLPSFLSISPALLSLLSLIFLNVFLCSLSLTSPSRVLSHPLCTLPTLPVAVFARAYGTLRTLHLFF